jgi:hypothetical protein
MKDVIRKTLAAGVETAFNTQLERTQFLVKNFTSGNIKVRLGNNTTDSMIGPNSWERVFNNVNNVGGCTIPDVTNVVIVTADVAGTVEVASIDG